MADLFDEHIDVHNEAGRTGIRNEHHAYIGDEPQSSTDEQRLKEYCKLKGLHNVDHVQACSGQAFLTESAKLPAIDKKIDTNVLHHALKGNDLVQYKLGTGKELTVAENKDGTYTVSLKEGLVTTISNFSSDGKLDMAKSYSMNGELRTGYQGPEASVAALKKVEALQPDIAFRNAF